MKVEIAISKHQFWPILQLISRSPFLSDWERKRQYSEPRRQRALVDVVFSQQLTRLPGKVIPTLKLELVKIMRAL